MRNHPDAVIPVIPGIDTGWVVETYGNDREFFLELLGVFLSRFGGAPAEIREHLAQGDRQAAARRLHTLKGTAGNLGVRELMAITGELEQAISAGRPDPGPLLEQMGAHLAALQEAAGPLLREKSETLSGPVGILPLEPSRLESLRAALSRNMLSALDLYDDLEPALRGAYGEQKSRTIAGAIRELRFAEALRLLELDR